MKEKHIDHEKLEGILSSVASKIMEPKLGG